MRHSLIVLILAVASMPAHSAVFISEYVEGSSYDKALEFYNTDSGAFDLGAAGCEIRGYQNGGTAPGWQVALTGSVPAEGTYVLAHTSASFGGDQTTGNLDFNGNDAVELLCNSTTLDVLGQIGFDPGSEWGSGDASTKDNTIRRKSTVCVGDDNGTDVFDPAIEWDGFVNGDYTGLGAHTVSCGPDITPPTIVSISPSTLGPTALTSITFTVLFSESVLDFDDLADVTVNHTGTSHTNISFAVNSGSSHTVTVSGITGTGSVSLTVKSAVVADGAGNPNSDTLTSVDVLIDPNVVINLPTGLLLSEIVVSPDGGEFIEIFNDSAVTLDLSDVYLTDATYATDSTFYYQIVESAGGGGSHSDFHARFPAGASIAAGEFQTIAVNGSSAFEAAYGVSPDYELYEDGVIDGIADMREAFSGSIGGQGGLSGGINNGEVAVLYYWDGQTDLVADLDYALWGDRAEAVDKSGVTMDGPDSGATASAYLNDTAVEQQTVIDVSDHAQGNSWQRVDFTEGSEQATGGNGLDGDNEMSESLRLTWGEGLATPGLDVGPDVIVRGPSILINEVNAVADTADEFIELFDGGAGGTQLGGLVLVLYDNSLQSYVALDLDGVVTDASGYLLIGGTNTPHDMLLPTALNDGAAAIGLYIGDGVDFTPGTDITSNGLIDALVYDSGQSDDADLLVLLEAGEAQVNEDGNGDALTESMQRCPNGAGGRRRTQAYVPAAPTPGMLNSSCPLGDYYASVNASNTAILRTTLHNTIDDHQWFPYTSGSTDTWDILDSADEDPNDPAKILDVYKNASFPKSAGGNSNYNREHTWPRSIGLGNTDGVLNSTATDAHNLRLSDIGYNSDRGNMPFDFCDPAQKPLCEERATLFNNGVGGGTGVYPGNSNWVTAGASGNSGSWDVWHDRRGDVARTMFYMDVRYEGGIHGVTGLQEIDLVLTNDRDQIQITTSSPAYMGLLNVLLAWHAQDPVDAKELSRNEIIFAFQGNRNPFVDHPEWVACLFENDCIENGIIFSDGFENTPPSVTQKSH